MVDAATKKTLSGIPLCKTKAGPRDKEVWVPRLKEEYQSLIKYVSNNKARASIHRCGEGVKPGQAGGCWHVAKNDSPVL